MLRCLEIAGPSEGKIVPQVAILESRQKFSTGESCQLDSCRLERSSGGLPRNLWSQRV